MLGGADNTNGELPSYITDANTRPWWHRTPRQLSSLLILQSK
ncbi:hypothetical protein ACOIPX_005617 [Salmonella enterica]